MNDDRSLAASSCPAAIEAITAAPRIRASKYPPRLAERLGERTRRPLGKIFGLTNFGVNLVTLRPGAMSSLRHAHTRQDEFVYVLDGELMLVTDVGTTLLKPGMCAGFRAGTGNAHHLVNASGADALFLEIGDRTANDSVEYPDDDLAVRPGPDGRPRYERKNGVPY